MRKMTNEASSMAKLHKQTLSVIWFSCIAMVGFNWGIYIIAKFTTKGSTPNPSSAWMIITLAVISLAECIGAWIFHRIAIAKISRQLTQEEAAHLSRETIITLERRIQIMLIICLAMFESIAIYGTVGSLLRSPYPNTFECFAMFGLLNLIIYRIKAYPAIFNLLDQLERIRWEIK